MASVRDHKRTVLLIVLYIFVGIIAGVGAIIFQQLLSLLNIFLLEGTAGYTQITIVSGIRRFELPWEQPLFRPWLLPLIASAGGLITGLIVYRFAPEAAGHGTDEVIHSYHHEQGRIRLRVSVVKLVGSAITIGSGGSGGKEGPIAQIGAGFGSFICSRIPYYSEYRRQIMLAGMAAGIAAIFRAPLAGAIFAAEILHSDMRYNGKVLIPAVIASTVAYGVYALYFGFDPVLSVPSFSYQLSLLHLLPFTVLALLSSFGAFMFVRVFYGTRDFFQTLRLKPYLKPALGGLLTGLVALWFSPAFGEGSYHMQQVINGDLPLRGMFLLVFLKMLTTSFSIGSGGSGGIFGPSLMIGAALGGVFGGAYLTLLGSSEIPLVVFVLLGMVGFFAGAANAPISTVIIISEMTRTFNLAVPFLWVAMFGYIFCQRWNIYENQVVLKRHILDAIDPLESQKAFAALTVAEAMITEFKTMNAGMPIGEALEFLDRNSLENAPVVEGEGGRLLGILDRHALSAYLQDNGMPETPVRALLSSLPESVYEDEALLTALRRLEYVGQASLPVLSSDGSERTVGLLSKEVLLPQHSRSWLNFLSAERITTDLSGMNREDVVKELCEIVRTGVPDYTPEQIRTAVMEREQQMTTALGRAVAFPHARIRGLRRPVVALGRSLKGIDWNAGDRKRVRLVFLALTPAEDNSLHMQITRGIVSLIREQHVRADLLRSAKPELMMSRIQAAVEVLESEDDTAGDG